MTGSSSKRLALALLAPAAAVLALEGAARLFQWAPPSGFLVRRTVDGQPFWAENEYAARRYFGKAPLRKPVWLLVPEKKAEGERRIVVLGESAALGDPAPEFGLARQIEAALQAANPTATITVINAAMTAINSHVIKDIARDTLALQPDAMVLLCGNNEFIGPYGPASILAPFQTSDLLIRLHQQVQRLHLTQALRARQPTPPTREWGGLNAFTQTVLPPGDHRIGITRKRFIENILHISSTCRDANIPLILLTVPVNLRDCPPFASDDTARPSSQQLFDEAVRRESIGDATNALSAYAAARDADAMRFRTDSTMNRLLRTLATQEQLPLVDAESIFAQDAAPQAPGDTHFLDHVHFTFRGNVLLGASVAAEVAKQLNLSGPIPGDAQILMREALAYTDWNEHRILRLMYHRLRGPPYDRWADHAARMAALEARVVAADPELKPGALDEAAAAYERALARRPRDWVLHEKAAMLAITRGEDRRAAAGLLDARALAARADAALDRTLSDADKVAHLVTLRSEQPAQAADALFQMGRARLRAGLPDQALLLLAEAVALDPSADEAWVDQGVALARLGRLEEARSSFDRALALNEGNVPALHNQASLLLRMDRPDLAAEGYRRVLERDPNHLPALRGMAETRAVAGDITGAREWLARALRYAPGDLAARWMDARLAHQAGDTDAAARALAALAANAPPPVANQMAMELADWGATAPAIALLERHILIHTGDAVAMSNLAWLLGCAEDPALRQPARARELAQTAARLRPRDPNILYAHASVLRAAGAWDEVRRIAAEAKALPMDAAQRRLWDALERGTGGAAP